MRIRFKKLTAGEPDYERGLLILGMVVLAVADLVVEVWPERWLPACLFRRLTGVPCPTCGLIRSLRLLAAGRLYAAWLQQPLVTVALVVLAAGSAYAAAAVLFNRPRARLERVSHRAKRVMLVLLITLVLVNWAYLIGANHR
jgi:hypothetical protein